MAGHDKRVFSVAFGLVNNRLEREKRDRQADEQADDEMMLMVLQFTTL